MKTSAAVQIASSATRNAQQLDGGAANETDSKAPHEAPPITLTDAQKKKLAAQAKALPATALTKPPSYLNARLIWMAGIQAAAWSDRDVITTIDDGQEPLTVRDLEEFGRRVEFAREVEANRGVHVSRGESDIAKMSDQDLWSEMLRHRVTLCDALKLRVSRDAGMRESVTSIRRASRQVDVSRALRQLINLFAPPEMTSWVAKLPRGEGPALTRLRALYAEWDRRHAQGQTPSLTIADDDLMQRVWTLAIEPLDRVLTLGRYLTRGVKGRDGDYAGFQQPRSAKPKNSDASKKTPVTRPVTEPTG